MNQQINLYQPILRREAKVFSSRAMLLGLLLVALGLLALSAVVEWRLRVQEAELAELEAQRQGLQQRLTVLEVRFPEPRRDPALERQVAAGEEELRRKRRFLEVFGAGSQAGADYAAVLDGLARAAEDDLWLTRIVLDGRGAASLQGLTLDAARLPLWMERLGEQPGLAEQRFQGLRVERLDERALRFELEAAGGDQ
ncbi:PilN domain-containing protein [Alkalilimnicola sp. S0819]|uniref:PilN domain-containing protein n=1 Tax=Alkalilimnicola sp. S0819 TaxID=2613922 RepID=UPI001261C8B6|nr:PilN domain-containing protein [Alkalilimnicola sp. S0819]KAB7622644.1 PilN domain-containing protein [Alkalilimnicola sp. S0819]MPQ17415.1 hypothetical protein [Alkalilimnicola sp. S0819]